VHGASDRRYYIFPQQTYAYQKNDENQQLKHDTLNDADAHKL